MSDLSGSLGYFGDARRAATGEVLLERLVETGSLVIRQLGGTRAGEIAIHRFLSAPAVGCVEMVETLAARTASACAGRRIVAVQDTTEVNFAGREARRRGLGPAGDGVSAGLFLHPLVAVDSAGEAVLGLLGVQTWTRSGELTETPARERPLEEKESRRWLEGAACAADRLQAKVARLWKETIEVLPYQKVWECRQWTGCQYLSPLIGLPAFGCSAEWYLNPVGAWRLRRRRF